MTKDPRETIRIYSDIRTAHVTGNKFEIFFEILSQLIFNLKSLNLGPSQ